MSKTLCMKHVKIIKLYIFVIQILTSSAFPSFFSPKARTSTRFKNINIDKIFIFITRICIKKIRFRQLLLNAAKYKF